MVEATNLRLINIGDLVKEKSLHAGWDYEFDCYFISEDLFIRLSDKGVLWKHPSGDKNLNIVFRRMHAGQVDSDGNCLFTAVRKSMALDATLCELRTRTIHRFIQDLGSVDQEMKDFIESVIRHMYSLDLKTGWGIHVVQEVKLLANKLDRESLDSAIDELFQLGMQREMAAESIYEERCIAVADDSSWVKYMPISGSPDDEYHIINMQYTEWRWSCRCFR